MRKIINFTLLIVFMVLTHSDAVDYMFGGAAIPMSHSQADNLNPSFINLKNGFSAGITMDFNSEQRYYSNIQMVIPLERYKLSLKYEDYFSSKKLLKLSFAGMISDSMIYGLTFKNFLNFEKYTFDIGFLLDKRDFFWGVSVLNIGGFAISDNFKEVFNKGIFPQVTEYCLQFEDDMRIKQGIVTSFTFVNNERFFITMQFNSFISSIEDMKDIGWKNLYWGIMYKLPDGSFVGFGSSYLFNSAGIGYELGGLVFSYVFLWQTKKFSYHLFSVQMNKGRKLDMEISQ